MKPLFFLLISIAIIGCNTTKTGVSSEEEANSTVMNEQEMMEAGFLKGTIVASAVEGDCPYVIEVEAPDYNYMLDPMNLEEGFMEDGAQVWFKFAGLRRPNRCEKASPVNLIEIKRRQ